MSRRNVVLLITATVVVTIFAMSIIVTAIAVIFGVSFGGAPAETITPTKTLVPTFTATPTIVPIPTDTPTPTETLAPTMPPETPTPTETATPTLGPPTSTSTPRPPAPTPTPRPPAPTNTPQPVYEYYYVSGPRRDQCHAGSCLPEIRGDVLDAQGNPVPRYSVWMKLESVGFGVEWCAVGDEAKLLQPGQFKFESHGGQLFGDYKLTVTRGQGGPPLSAAHEEGMKSMKSQHTLIVFRKY